VKQLTSLKVFKNILQALQFTHLMLIQHICLHCLLRKIELNTLNTNIL